MLPKRLIPFRLFRHPRRKRYLALTVFGVFLLSVTLFGRPVLHLASVAWHDVDQRENVPPGQMDDASRMNATKVMEIWPVPVDAEVAKVQLIKLVHRAQNDGLQISIAGSRHSMGGHCLMPDGIVIDMTPFNKMDLDEDRDILHVQSGAKWRDIIPYLDQRGKSVAIMQSNNSFTVGGSISVNCHGWQHGRPPICSTVESFRLLLADGTIVPCSRTENEELFSLALGGYGLFGVILDVDLRVVPNERYRAEQTVVGVEEALNAFDRVTSDANVAMIFARMNIAPDAFLDEVIINSLHREPDSTEPCPPLTGHGMVSLRRGLFRGSAASDYGKELRWQAESRLQAYVSKRYYSRNQLLNEGVEVFENRTTDYTDILHEYFVPRDGLVRFVDSLREIVPRHKGDLLNVTVRSVEADEETFLRYADRPMFAFVMLFHQPRSAEGDHQMEAMTGELIEAAVQLNGRYYLPYRLHATAEQFRKAYPQAEEFFQLKRTYDPDELFQNKFYLKYGQVAERGQDLSIEATSDPVTLLPTD